MMPCMSAREPPRDASRPRVPASMIDAGADGARWDSAPMDTFTEPDFSKVALITIDTQVDVLDGQPFEIPGTSAVLPRMRELLEGFRAKGAPIVHIVRIYEHDASNVDRCRRAAILAGTPLLLKDSPGC